MRCCLLVVCWRNCGVTNSYVMPLQENPVSPSISKNIEVIVMDVADSTEGMILPSLSDSFTFCYEACHEV